MLTFTCDECGRFDLGGAPSFSTHCSVVHNVKLRSYQAATENCGESVDVAVDSRVLNGAGRIFPQQYTAQHQYPQMTLTPECMQQMKEQAMIRQRMRQQLAQQHPEMATELSLQQMQDMPSSVVQRYRSQYTQQQLMILQMHGKHQKHAATAQQKV